MENVIIIVLDCLRYDYSGEIWDVLKDFGFVRAEAIAAAPWTIPSHASMLTGLYPSEHGAHETKERKVGKIEFKVRDNLVNDLKKKGYRTYLFTANTFLTERFGFCDFDYVYFNGNIPDRIYLRPEELRILTEETLIKDPKTVLVTMFKSRRFRLLLKGGAVYLYRKFSEMVGGWPVEKGISKITSKIRKTEFEEPFMIFVNLMELHEPYRSKDIRKEYEHQLRYLKSKFETFMKVLDEKELLRNSIAIVTSDHGQLLGENGRTGHGIYLDDELIRVPFFLNAHVEGDGYISHTNMRSFILRSLNGTVDAERLFTDVAFSEAFGSYSRKIKVDSKFEKHRIAVFYEGRKGIYDVESRKFDYLSDPTFEDDLRAIVEKFIRSARRKALELELRMKIRKIKENI